MQDNFAFTADQIKSALRPSEQDDVKFILRFQRVALLLNTAFALAFLLLYVWLNNAELLISLLIISTGYAFLIINSLILLRASKALNRDASLKRFLTDQLALINIFERRTTQSTPVIFTVNFIAGFIGGLILNERTFIEVISHPAFMAILAIFSVGCYFAAKKYACRLPRGRFSAAYFTRKARIQASLDMLNGD